MSIETVYPMNSNWTIRVSSANRPFFYTSLICKPQDGMTSFNDNIVAILVKMVSSTDVIKDDVVLHWHVIFGPKSAAGSPPPDDHKVATKFSVIADEIAAVVIVPKVGTLLGFLFYLEISEKGIDQSSSDIRFTSNHVIKNIHNFHRSQSWRRDSVVSLHLRRCQYS